MSPLPARYGAPGTVYGVSRYATATAGATLGGKKVVQHVSLAFASLPDAGLDSFVESVSSKLYGNAAYPAPTVTQVALDAANTRVRVLATQLGEPLPAAAPAPVG